MKSRPLVCALLATAASSIAFAEPSSPAVPDAVFEAATNVLFRDSFETSEAGAFPSSWEIGCGKPSVAPEAGQNGQRLAQHNKVLRLTPGDYVFRVFDKPAKGRLQVEFDYLTPSGQNSLLLVTLGDLDPTQAERRAASYCTDDVGAYVHWMGNFIAYFTEQETWTRFARWKPGVWNHARVVLDAAVGLFDFYGSNFTSSGVFRHRQKKVRGIGLRHHGTAGNVCIDNIVVSAIHD